MARRSGACAHAHANEACKRCGTGACSAVCMTWNMPYAGGVTLHDGGNQHMFACRSAWQYYPYYAHAHACTRAHTRAHTLTRTRPHTHPPPPHISTHTHTHIHTCRCRGPMAWRALPQSRQTLSPHLAPPAARPPTSAAGLPSARYCATRWLRLARRMILSSTSVTFMTNWTLYPK